MPFLHVWFVVNSGETSKGASRVSNYGLECAVLNERKVFVKWNAF